MDHNFSMQRKKIRIGDISISYFLKESSTPPQKTVVFLHGFPFNKNMWLNQLETLPNNVSGIAVDVRGHGLSTIGHGYFSIDVFAKDLIVFIEKLNLKEVVLCGLSMGGYIALRANQLAPHLFKGLVLADTNSQADSDEAKIKRFETIQSVLKFGRRVFAIGFVKRVFSEESLLTKMDEVEMIRSSIRRNDVRSICATLLALASRTDTTDSLQNIPFPCLIIRGAEDQLMSVEQTEILRKNIKNAKLEVMDKCGHLPNLEDPTTFNRLLNQYLNEL
ncbi:alpha/beta hydrolase [Olivibacter sp. SDN3]|uniref:alpha/beta fold hydrolase n=1 Tax=Olivibacter sp. SDN3 TaxID=2764720 RepID=UPI001650E5FF|nr:alpha/beta hydrolase [Olivibacter sp. SDN3]QNL50130.1 alpha/beta hydrolase [Olivibacter sp. SDN3]